MLKFLQKVFLPFIYLINTAINLLSKGVFCFLVLICGLFEIVFFYIKQYLFGNAIPNFKTVDHKLFRGGQPSKKGVQELAKKGVGIVINLRYKRFFQKKLCMDSALEYRSLPFYPYGPSESIIIEFIKIVKQAKKPIFVHCFHGEDRTGFVCAIYRIFIQNWEKERAILEMKKMGLHWWHKNLSEFVQNLDIQRIKLSCRLLK